MKVAVNARLLLPHRMEGVARYIYETTRCLVRNNPEVEFHLLFDRPYDKKFILGKNVIPHVIGPQSRHPFLWYFWFEKSLAKFFRNNKMDVFYSGDMYLSLSANVPTLYVSHDLNYIHYPKGIRWSHLKYYQKYMPVFHDNAEHIIAVSQATKSDIVKQFKIPLEKISVAGNALPKSIVRIENNQLEAIRGKLTGGAPYFVYVGSLHPRKNVDTLIEAFNIFKSEGDHEHKLVIYGRSAWKTSAIKNAYDTSKYKSDIVFNSGDSISVSEVLSASLALCYISLFEGFGIPILEAFECEVPVITSDVSSMPEVAGNAALLVDPKNKNMISRAMFKLVDSPALRKSLILKGKARVVDYSWEQSAQLIFQKLNDIRDDIK